MVIGLFFLPDYTDNEDGSAALSDEASCDILNGFVCGQDGKTYDSSCAADEAQVAIAYQGECDENKILFENLNTVEGLFCIVSEENEFFINNNTEYEKLTGYISDHDKCQNYSLSEIDFLDITLLGKYASGSGCEVDFARTIEKDEKNKKYVYAIEVLEEGFCEQLVSSMNWITVPKIPQDYTIEIKVE